MEDWQRTNIKENLPSLLELTSCNPLLFAILESEGVLSSDDTEEIGLEQRKKGQSRILYNILLTKTNGYWKLVEALVKTNQTGAIKILLQVPSAVINNLQVSYLQEIYELKTVLNPMQIEEIRSWLQANVSTETLTSFTYLEELSPQISKVELVKATIPEQSPLYISRFLSLRVVVNPAVFQENFSDVFVFKDVLRSKLRKLLPSYGIESSTSQLLKKKITSRFIILESQADWKKICGKLETPVHLIQYEETTETFTLEATSGGSSILHKHLKHRDKSRGVGISEEEFMDNVFARNAKAVCICDSPGMGKTLLLGSLSKRISKKCPDRIVAFIQLRHFVLPPKPNKEDVATWPKSVILKHISKSPIAYRILYELSTAKETKFELFFDGLDEVQESYFERITEFFRQIGENMPEARVYITSRTVVRNKLEEIFGVIAYDIEPFNEETRSSYLTTHWAQDTSSDPEKLKEYAKFCLQHVACSLTENERNITGIPLLCRLIAEVYSEEASVYADKDRSTSVKLPEIFVNSLSEIYAKYIQRQLGPTNCNYDCMCTANSCNIACLVKSYHIWQALQVVLPNVASQISKHVVNFENLSLYKILAPGILEKSQVDGNVEFVHRTFAEYLVAEYCDKVVFTKPSIPDNYQRLVVQSVFDEIFTPGESISLKWDIEARCLREGVVAHFLNFMIESKESNMDSFCTASIAVSPAHDQFLSVLEGCLHFDYTGLLGILMKATENKFASIENNNAGNLFILFQDKDNDSEEENTGKEDQAMRVLIIATQYCKVETLDTLCNFSLNTLNADLIALSQSSTRKPLPIQVAIERADFKVARFFIERVSIENKGLLYKCVERTYSKNDMLVEIRLDIAQLLLSKSGHLLIEQWNNYRSPLLACKIHLKAIKFLVESGANIGVFDDLGRTVFYSAAKYMSETCFYELCKFLFDKYKGREIFADSTIWKTYLSKLSFKSCKEITRTLLRILRIFCYEDRMWSRPNYFCVEGRQEQDEILKSLLQLEFNKTYIEIFTSLFYGAVTDGKLRVVELLLSYDSKLLETKYEESRTALLLAAEIGNSDMTRLLVLKKANIFAVDSDGNTVLHLAAKTGSCEFFQKLLHSLGDHWKVTPFNECTSADQRIRPSGTEPSDLYELFTWRERKHSTTPLHSAVKWLKSLSLEILDLLFAYGRISEAHTQYQPFANINDMDIEGNSVLLLALQCRQSLQVIKRLIRYGANWSVKNNHGMNVIHTCACMKLPEHLNYFLGLGCSVNELDFKGNTALHWALYDFKILPEAILLETLRILIKAGVHRQYKNIKCKTAYDIAVENQLSQKVLSLLVQEL